MNRILIFVVVMVIVLSGCINTPKKPDPFKTQMIDDCLTMRRSKSRFNARKSFQLVRYECRQMLTLNEAFRKVDDKKSSKKPNLTYFDQQEDFDAEAWFLITELVRKKYYPDYLEPEQEVIRANDLSVQQVSTTNDKSVWREWQPRLLPVSPYLMHYKQLKMAQEAISELIHQKKGDSFFTKLKVISTIMVKEGQKKDPYRYRY